MAVKISTDGFLNVHRPLQKNFSIDDMSSIIITDKEKLQFVDIGIFVLVIDCATNRTMNSVGSLYFRFPIFGNLLILSANELPEETLIKTDENSKYTTDELESGIIKSIKDVLTTYKMLMSTNTKNALNNLQSFDESNSQESYTPTKRIFYFNPDNEGEITKEEESFIETFYLNVFETIKGINHHNIANIKLYEDIDCVIMFMPGMICKTIDNIIDYFTKKEEYEKCAILTKKNKLFKDLYNDI